MLETHYKVGNTYTDIKKINNEMYAVFLHSGMYSMEHCKNKLVSPCETFEKMQSKLDIYAKIKKLKVMEVS